MALQSIQSSVVSTPPDPSINYLADLLSIVDDFYDTIDDLNALRKTTEYANVKELIIPFSTEAARYAEWKARMRFRRWHDIRGLVVKLPRSDRERLLSLLEPAVKHIREGIGSSGSSNFPALIGRASETAAGPVGPPMEQKNLLYKTCKVLKECNDGLLSITPPPPGYFIRAIDDESQVDVRPSQMIQSLGLEVLQGPELEVLRGPEIVRSQRHLPVIEEPSRTVVQTSRPILVSSSSDGQNMVELSTNEEKVELPESDVAFCPMVELLYSTCLRVLRSISSTYPSCKHHFRSIADRLSLWGSGLFYGRCSLDQALDQPSSAVLLLKENLAGTLADVAVIELYILSVLDGAEKSASALQLEELFAIEEIAFLPLGSLSEDIRMRIDASEPVLIEYWSEELADLVESLFCNLATIELVLKAFIFSRTGDSALVNRELVLKPDESNVHGNPNGQWPAQELARTDVAAAVVEQDPARELLKIDIALIAAMRESLKDRKHAKYLENKDPSLDAQRLSEALGEQSRQITYWSKKLEESDAGHGMTPKTKQAMMLNLARIARTFDAGFKSETRDKGIRSDDIKAVLKRCLADYPDVDAATDVKASDTEYDVIEALRVLQLSNQELRRLATSKAPYLPFNEDFIPSDKTETSTKGERSTTPLMIERAVEERSIDLFKKYVVEEFEPLVRGL